MTTLRQAAQQALEALDRSDYFGWQSNIPIIKSLREALAQPEPEPVAIVVAAEYEDGSHAGHHLEWHGRNEANDYPEGTKLYTHPPQHPTETEAEYGSEADTEELLRVGAMPEPLRLAAMLEKTMQWPLHGIAADCLRRMHNEAQRKPLTNGPIGEIAIQDTQYHGYAMAIKPHIKYALPEGTKLYTTPPQRKPLTDEEICKLWDSHTIEVFGKIGINPVVFARYLERAHGIGGEQ